jgi:outer membrane protein
MKKNLLTLVFGALFLGAALTASAQPAAKVLVVDMVKLLDGHPETRNQKERMRVDEENARQEIEKLGKEAYALGEEYKALVQRAKSPELPSVAKIKAEADAQAKFSEMEKKQNQFQSFRLQTEQSFQQRIANVRDVALRDIAQVVTTIAKNKGATVLLDKSGPSLLGISSVLYFDSACDITEEALRAMGQ